MSAESFQSSEHTSLRNWALFMGASVLTTTALVTYALVKDSGATVADLGRDVWDGIRPGIKKVPERLAETVKGQTTSVMEICKDEVEMLNHDILRHFREDR